MSISNSTKHVSGNAKDSRIKFSHNSPHPHGNDFLHASRQLEKYITF